MMGTSFLKIFESHRNNVSKKTNQHTKYQEFSFKYFNFIKKKKSCSK